ncbi:MAG: protein kinase [Bryobacteraceae bacterium]
MQLSVGDRLGPYEIVASLGEGGMGQVYRARDTRLQREVAVKVSSEQFSERFAREAQLIAALNHPNICTLFDVGPNYLVMELIEGPTLFDRMAQGAMPLEEAVPVAVQIAEALEAAHDKGIVHRDLKPANIKLTADGKVKVLDFGLAKALEGDASAAPSLANSPTLAPTRVAATQAGFILGTAGYMAPEQARGHAVDRRADIFAYGVVLWEMVTGRRMFDGETVSDTLAQILTQTPAVDAAPVSLRPLLTRCLEKDRKKRLQAIGEARIALETPVAAPVVAEAAVASGRGGRWVAVLAGVATIAAVIAGVAVYRLTHPDPAPLTALEVHMGREQPTLGMGGSSAILSPDGRRIAFLDEKFQLWTRTLDQPEAVMLHASGLLMGLFFSPDGQWIGFSADGKLKKIPVTGGLPANLTDVATGTLRGAHWGADGFLYFSESTAPGVQRIPANGGARTVVTKLDEARGEQCHFWPQLLPNSKALLFSSTPQRENWRNASVELQRMDTGARQTLVRGGSYARYVPSGHILYANGATLMAMPFDAERLEVKGQAVPILEGVMYLPSMGYSQFHVSDAGTLLYRKGSTANQMLNWISADGQSPAYPKAGNYERSNWSLSPDAKQLAVVQNNSIWTYEFASERQSRLTFGETDVYAPVWCPDGSCILFRHGSDGIWWIPSNGAGKAKRLLSVELGALMMPRYFLSSGREIVVAGRSASYRVPIQFVNKEPVAGKPERVDFGPSSRVSPDGLWAAHVSQREQTLMVASWPDGQAKFQVASNASAPAWNPASRELLYRDTSEHRVMAVPYEVKGGAFVPGKPRVWSVARLGFMPGNLSITPDGKRILASVDVASGHANNTVFFYFHFLDDLKRRFR